MSPENLRCAIRKQNGPRYYVPNVTPKSEAIGRDGACDENPLMQR